MKVFLLSLFCGALFCSSKAQLATPDVIPTSMGSLSIQPVQHATVVFTVGSITIYADPTSAGDYTGQKAPDMILITDIHGDHLDTAKLDSIKKPTTLFIVPQAVADKLPQSEKEHLVILKNGDVTKQIGITIKAIPMYNLPESPTAFHTKGRGNGYVLTIGGKNIYLSGDTQGIPEMRALKNIDVAFVCMNLPYTMDDKEAADAVLAFSPKIVYPYHYRGQSGMMDVNEFQQLVQAKNKNIDVRLRNWYLSK